MEKNIPISKEAGLALKIEGGKVKVGAVLDTKGLDAEIMIVADSDYFIDELVEKLGGGAVAAGAGAILKEIAKKI